MCWSAGGVDEEDEVYNWYSTAKHQTTTSTRPKTGEILNQGWVEIVSYRLFLTKDAQDGRNLKPCAEGDDKNKV